MKPTTPPNLWNDGLKLVSYCPSCDSRTNAIQARVLGKDGETHLLHVTCKKCENATLALVLLNQGSASSVGLMTDLLFDDVWRFRQGGSVTVDHVIETHRFLESEAWKAMARPKRRAPVRTARVRKPKK